MLKFVVRNKKLLLWLNKMPVVKRCFVFDFTALNTIEDEDFYNLVFSHIIVSNGLTKTTRSGRFSDLDEVIVQLLQKVGKAAVHDTGVSNGVTSLELYKKLEQAGVDADFYVSDKFAKIYYKGNAVKKFYDADGHLISVNFLFCHFSPRIGKAFFLSRWLFTLFQQKKKPDKSSLKEIVLLAPPVYKQIAAGNILLPDFDVFETRAIQSFTFLRCMNVLMPAYFSTDRIVEGVNNLKNNLVEGGYLLLGRTDADNVNHASLYICSGGQLQLIQVFNRGFDYNNPL